MPAADADLVDDPPQTIDRLPFPPTAKSHILNCSYHSWYRLYRSITPKARLIPLSEPFLEYLRADGLFLPPEPGDASEVDPDYEDDADGDENRTIDVSLQWPDIYAQIKSTITELGGSVMPKLNWSAPKDATWIAATNSMECRTPNDIYLLLKSSDFITHDLEEPFIGCEPDPTEEASAIPYHLALRKTVPALQPAHEFRCFVRARHLLCISQRDLNFYDFLEKLMPDLRKQIQTLFDTKLRETFPDPNFVFDVYISNPASEVSKRVWLIDINPWLGVTDPLLFSWMEILNMPGPMPSSSEMEAAEYVPELRLVAYGDPEAGFGNRMNAPQYSAHKLPRDVVDASLGQGNEVSEILRSWREAERGRYTGYEGSSEEDENEEEIAESEEVDHVDRVG